MAPASKPSSLVLGLNRVPANLSCSKEVSSLGTEAKVIRMAILRISLWGT